MSGDVVAAADASVAPSHAASLAIAFRRAFALCRPIVLHMFLLVYLPVLLVLDARVTSLVQQHLLGLATALVLGVAVSFSPAAEQRMVCYVVLFWACVEVLGSVIWGIYTYRLGNLPLYVPFGHGLIYLAALRMARTPFAAHYGDGMARLAVRLAVGWALLGLTLLPWLTGRMDVAGAALLLIFVYGMTRSRAAVFYATVFFATSLLEVLGTSLGNWQWAEHQPLTMIPQGNPPSVIAGAYCIWDCVMVRVVGRVRRGRGG